MPTCNLIIQYNILIMRDRSPEPQCELINHVCVYVYRGSVVLMSLTSSLKYSGARTMTGSEEEMDRGGSPLDSTTAFTKPSQSNYGGHIKLLTLTDTFKHTLLRCDDLCTQFSVSV